MKAEKVVATNLLVFIGVVSLCAGPASECHGAPRCSDGGGNSPYVCVGWNETNPPDAGFDFVFDFSDPANPDVTLKTGNDNWKVWSQVSQTDPTPADIGDIKIDATISTDDFTVTIANGTGVGAVNVKSLNLIDFTNANWAGGSSIGSGSRITGSLGGSLVLRKNSAGGGGSANGFTIDGDATFDITVPHAAGLTINGKFGGQGDPLHQRFLLTVGDIVGGDLTIGSLEDTYITLTDTPSLSNGQLLIEESATGNNDISLQTIENGSGIVIGSQASVNPWPTDVNITAYGDLPADCTIDASNAVLNGAVALLGGSANAHGTILINKLVAGAVVARNLTGQLSITKDFLAPGQLLHMQGDMTGMIDIGGKLDGNIQIDGLCDGQIEIGRVGQVL